MASGAAIGSRASAQDRPSARILRREVRVTRGMTGNYRVIEALRLWVEPAPGDTGVAARRVPLLRLQDVADGVVGIGGDVDPSRVQYDPPGLTLAAPIEGEAFQVIATYYLPPGVPVVELRAALPADTLIVEIARGSIEARVDRALTRAGVVGSASRPRVKYVARGVAADSTVRIRLGSHRTGWRERLGVLVSTALAACLAAAWTWRRGRRSSY